MQRDSSTALRLPVIRRARPSFPAYTRPWQRSPTRGHHHARRQRRPKRSLRLPDRRRVQFRREHEGRADRRRPGQQRLLAGRRCRLTGRRCPEWVGTFLGAGAITFGDGASIKGRALTPGTVAVTNSPFTEPVDDFDAPLVTIDGGAARSTNDTTPSISGTTDEPVGRHVTVTVGGQTLTATVGASGAWNVSAGPLMSGPHDVVASITDASQNVGSASQILTVDLTSPTVLYRRRRRCEPRTTPRRRSRAPATSLRARR